MSVDHFDRRHGDELVKEPFREVGKLSTTIDVDHRLPVSWVRMRTVAGKATEGVGLGVDDGLGAGDDMADLLAMEVAEGRRL